MAYSVGNQPPRLAFRSKLVHRTSNTTAPTFSAEVKINLNTVLYEYIYLKMIVRVYG